MEFVKKNVIICIIMPTLNSEKTIRRVLESIKMQTIYPNIEVLVIDGGSSDNTLSIASEYGVRILNNPQRIPETAKQVGFREAKGQYIIMQDSDEVLTDERQYEKRLELFEKWPDIYLIIADELIPGKNVD